MNIKMNYKLAMAYGQDEGNRNMLKNSRVMWNEEDWNRAAEAFKGLWGDEDRKESEK